MNSTTGDPITIAVTFVPTNGASATTVIVSATSTTTWNQLRPLLPATVRDQQWYGGRDEVLGTNLVGRPPLVHAAQLTDAPQHPTQRSLLELAIAEGPDCGQFRAVSDQMVLGRDLGCGVPVRDSSLSREHLRISMRHGEVSVLDLQSTNGSWVDTDRLHGQPHELRVGQRLRTGMTVSRLQAVTTPVPLPLRSGRRALSRAPRQVPELTATELTRPTLPRTPEHALPWLVILIPIPVAVVLALVMRSPMFLAFALFSPLMMLGQYLHDRIGGRRTRREELVEFTARTEALEQTLSERLAREVTDRRRLAPDLAELATHVRTGRCWARRPGDADYLLWRLGTGTLTAGVTVRSESDTRTYPLSRVPITVDLDADRVSGVTGPSELLDRGVDALVGTLIATHSPALLRLIVISAHESRQRWGWLSWVPHLRPDTTGDPLIFHPDRDDEQVRSVLSPWSEPPDQHRLIPGETRPAVHTVVLLDGSGLTHRPLLHSLVQHGPKHGVAIIAAATNPAGLPSDCTVTVALDDLTQGRLLISDTQQPFTPDLPTMSWRGQIASTLAGTIDTTPGAQGGEPPSQARLLDILEEEVTAQTVSHRWRLRHRSTHVLLGLGAAGPVAIDLVRDGPHALVGGTTGSGKSEFLQSLITSLALGNRPDELVFLLVDYKGGAAFKDCALLPHTLGLVTDLDPFLTHRALSSLDAEIRRRERILGAIGAKDLEDYQRQVGADGPTVPRLVLVIDEFRVLAEELPDFIEGVVRLAAVGRSLGIHVILATQRPAGIVSADIRANVNLRIALRVRDTSDSEDIIDSPAAAQISAHTPGRALLRTGATPPVAVQSARIGGSARAAAAVRVLPVDPVTARLVGIQAQEEAHDVSDLRLVVDAMRVAAEADAVAHVASPWLPSLPRLITRRDCSAAPRLIDGGEFNDSVPFVTLGMLDVPSEQLQLPAAWALGSGHLAVVGGPRSGRTTAVRSALVGLTEAWSADDVHVYAIDTAGALSSVAALPHTGAVIPAADTTGVSRMMSWLAAESARRQQALAHGDHADLAEQRQRPGTMEALPYLLLVIDGWDSFQADYELGEAATIDTFLSVLRDGPAVGLSVLITGGRAVLSGRVAGVIQHRLCLRMADEMDLVMAGLSPTQVPSEMPPGRALLLPDGHELQIAIPGESASGADQSEAVRTVAAASAKSQLHPPKRFAGLPERVPISEVQEAARSMTVPEQGLLLGVGGEESAPILWDPDPIHGQVALIAGPPGSGRTSALHTLTNDLTQRGPVLWRSCAAPLTSPPPDLTLLGPGDAESAWQSLQSDFATLVIDDVELALDTAYDELAVAFLSRCAEGFGALLVAGSTHDLITGYRGIGHQLRRRSTGLILHPARGDGDLLGTTVPHSGRPIPGRGIFVQRARATEIQVASPASDTWLSATHPAC